MDDKNNQPIQNPSSSSIGRRHSRTLNRTRSTSSGFGSIQELKNKLGGKRVIEKILVANNGIAAVKCIRSIRHWSYQTFKNDQVFKFICMATPEDYSANAEFIRLANHTITVPGGSNNNNYGNVDLIVEIARNNQVDAVWAGWGHASENPRLPDLLEKYDIEFLGPSESAMNALGDKIASAIIAQTASVPTMPWNGDSLKLEKSEFEGVIQEVPKELYEKARIKTVEEGLFHAKRIGWPVMIKASAGGGGKGIRKCESEKEFSSFFSQVQLEVPGSPIFIMKLASGARHLEVQLLADEMGNCVSLFGRDCSIQRRHQKIIEEAPQTVAPSHIFHKMEDDAVRLAKLVGYRSTGTVEYLYVEETQEYYFLELNPRLQVEHPCTEMIANINLPVCQLLVGMGISLSRIPCVRKLYGKDQFGKSEIEFTEHRPKPSGHVIAARITSEDPDRRFQPSNGTVQEITFHSSKNAWGYFSVSSHGNVHEFADSQFGHCFAWEQTRDQAIGHMVMALKELHVQADFRTTTQYLVELLENDEFVKNKFSTQWLDSLISSKVTSYEDRELPVDNIISGACIIADKIFNTRINDYTYALERGQVLSTDFIKTAADVDLVYDNCRFKFHVAKISEYVFHLSNRLNNDCVEIEVHRLSDGGLLANFGGINHTTYLKEETDLYRVTVNNIVTELTKETDPSVLKSVTAGKLVRFLVPDGSKIKAGQKYCEIEVMKMIMTLQVAVGGVFHHGSFSAGSAIVSGAILARLTDLDVDSQDEKRKKETVDFDGPLIDDEEYEDAIDNAEDTGNTANKTSDNASNNVKAPKGLVMSPIQTSPQTARLSLPFKSLRQNSLKHANSIKNTFFHSNTNLSDDESVRSDNGAKPHHQLTNSFKRIMANLTGFCHPELWFQEECNKHINNLINASKERSLPLHELNDILNRQTSRLPESVTESIKKEATKYNRRMGSFVHQFPSGTIKRIINTYAAGLRDDNERGQYIQDTQPITELCELYSRGSKGRLSGLIKQIFEEYIRVENMFACNVEERNRTEAHGNKRMAEEGSFEICVKKYLENMSDLTTDQKAADLKKLSYDIVAYSQTVNRSNMIANMIHVVRVMESEIVKEVTGCLQTMTELVWTPEHRKVSLEARKALIEAYQPSFLMRKNEIENIFLKFMDAGGFELDTGDSELEELIHSEAAIFDVLPEFFYHRDMGIRCAALEVYIQRSYLEYELHDMEWMEVESCTCAYQFEFTLPVAHPNNSDDFNEVTLNTSLNSSKATGTDITKHARSSSFNSTVGTSNIPLEFHMNVNRLAENASDDSITYAESANNRLCYMCCYKSFNDLQTGFFALIQKLYDLREYNMPPFMVSSPIPNFYFDQNHNSPETEKNLVLYLIVRMQETEDSNEDDDSRILQDFLKQNVNELKEHQIRRVTFMIPREKRMPSYFTYRARDFYEDKIYRHLEPGLAYQLELSRMRNFQITRQNTTNRKMQLYLGTTKLNKSITKVGAKDVDRRFFLRAIIRHSNLTDKRTSLNYLTAEGERMLLEAIDELDLAMQSGTVRTDCNHIFLNFVPTVVMNKIKLVSHIRELVLRYGIRLWKMRITQAELKVNLKEELDSEQISLRIVMSSENGYALDCDCYQEVFDPNDSVVKFKQVDLGEEFQRCRTSLNGMPINTAYPTRDLLQAKRYEAQSMGSSYVYDIVDLCRTGVWELWENHKEVNKLDAKLLPNKENVLTAEEFVLENDQIKKINRHVAQNKIGMVAWLIKILTPDSPKGREFFLVANDITYIQGSFGPKEDILYMRISEEARKMGIPRIYFAANAGARIGLVKDLQACYQVAWVDEANVNRGYDYFYLTPEDYQKYRNFVIAEHIEVKKNKNNGVLKEEDLSKESANDFNKITIPVENSSAQSELKSKAPKTTENSESDPMSENSENSETTSEQRYKILAIKGEDNQFGIKALSWSGAIAGETSRAYDECLTINVVSCRSVGIGAYIVRLGQRTIQVDSSCIILTGNKALNKVLGREVYTSNTQLGGKQIMHNNGVTHSIARSDEAAMLTAIKWMSFSPAKIDKFSFNYVPGIIDPIERDVTWTPQKGIPYNPSFLFTGEGSKTGLFDSNSYHEIMDGWAKTVQVGRGRIGGISVGCIVPETRSVSTEIPADPANPETDRRTTRQAGQVWFPDSAHKTAQAIRDFNREQIPLLIIGNWRGFSGGMKDMFDEILKFGALIVDELRKYKFPVIVYIPPFGELRGGAWAVLDPKINPEFMEMYCSESGRGGILEPEGIVEIKYRQKDQNLTLNRLGLGAHKEVQSLMHQMANEFVDLHDRPEALKANDVIKSVVQWKDSRKFLFFRFKRLLLQNQLRGKAIQGSHKSSYSKSNHHDSQLESGFFNAILQRKCEKSDVNWKNDEKVVVFLEKNDKVIVEEFLTETVMIQRTREITDFLLSSDTAGNALLESLKEIKGQLPVELRTQLVDLLKVDLVKTVPEVNLLRNRASTSSSGLRSRKQSTRESSTNQMTVVGNVPIVETGERTTPLSNFNQTGSPIDIIYRKSQPSTPRSTVNSNRVPHLKKPVDIKKDSNPKINNPESTDSENKHFFANASPSLTKRPSNLTLCSKGSQDDEANN